MTLPNLAAYNRLVHCVAERKALARECRLLILAPASGRVVVNDSVEPLGPRILIRKDEGRQQTKGGIVLPDSTEIPTITGRVVEISLEVQNMVDFPVRKYDKVLFNPKSAIPVDLEPGNVLYVVSIEDIVAVFRKAPKPKAKRRSSGKEGGDETPDEDF